MRRRAEYGRSTDEKFVSSRHGFTLIEVVVATAILLIILIPLMASFGRGVAGFKNAQLFTFAQNLAEFQAEDIKSLAPSVLNQLVEGAYPGAGLTADNPLVVYSNYPYAPTVGHPGYDAGAAANDAFDYAYDSGNIATNFNLIGLTKIYGIPYIAGASLAPDLPAGVPLLGPNIEILPYEDADYAATQWKYYRAVLHKEAYPLFSKRIQVTRYNANYLPDKTHHDAAGGDVGTLFDYTVTVSTRQSDGSVKTLYVTQGTIGSAYTLDPTTVTLTAPLGGEMWANSPTLSTVSWTVSGATEGIYGYRVRFSSDDGASYQTPVAFVLAGVQTVQIDPGVTDNVLPCRVMVEAVSSKGQVLGYDTSAGFTVGTPGGPGGLFVVHVLKPNAMSVWTVGQAATVQWSATGIPSIPVDQFVVELSTDGGATYGMSTTAIGTATSAILTPAAASANCVVRVTAQGAGGAPILFGEGTSSTFVTQTPLILTVNAPTASSLWTVGVAGSVSWSLNRAEPSIASYSVNFIPDIGGGPVVTGAGVTMASITPGGKSASVKVRVTALDAASSIVIDGDSAAFQVLDPLSVAVQQPAGGSTHKKNKDMVVNWTTGGDASPVAQYRVSLSTDNGATYAVKTTVAAGTYTATITLPNSTPSQCIVKVEALSGGGAVLATGLSGVFGITNSG